MKLVVLTALWAQCLLFCISSVRAKTRLFLQFATRMSDNSLALLEYHIPVDNVILDDQYETIREEAKNAASLYARKYLLAKKEETAEPMIEILETNEYPRYTQDEGDFDEVNYDRLTATFFARAQVILPHYRERRKHNNKVSPSSDSILQDLVRGYGSDMQHYAKIFPGESLFADPLNTARRLDDFTSKFQPWIFLEAMELKYSPEARNFWIPVLENRLQWLNERWASVRSTMREEIVSEYKLPEPKEWKNKGDMFPVFVQARVLVDSSLLPDLSQASSNYFFHIFSESFMLPMRYTYTKLSVLVEAMTNLSIDVPANYNMYIDGKMMVSRNSTIQSTFNMGTLEPGFLKVYDRVALDVYIVPSRESSLYSMNVNPIPVRGDLIIPNNELPLYN